MKQKKLLKWGAFAAIAYLIYRAVKPAPMVPPVQQEPFGRI